MPLTRNANSIGETDPAFEFSPIAAYRGPSARRFRILALLICLAHFVTLAYLARQHPLGTFATETDFYHLYAPDAERIAAGQFPVNTFQGPGYPATLALLAKLTGLSADLFTVGKWLSVIGAVICGLLTFLLFARLFSDRVGIGAQLVMLVSGQFPQFSLNATTDVFFLLLCLVTLVVFTGGWLSLRWRIALTGALIGLTYLTRYNGVFLLAGCLLAITLINQFDRAWRERSTLSVILLAAFFIVASPWLYANYRHTGSPFYNTNYLNIATEFYPELVAGKTNQDGTRALEQKFHSFGDVLLHDPRTLLSRYPANLYESLRRSVKDDLVNQWVGWAALLGVVLALFERRSKAVTSIIMAGSIYLLLMALNHWETRYYFFLMVLSSGFAVYAVFRLFELAHARGMIGRPVATIGGAALVAVMWTMSLAESRKDVARFLASHPAEIVAALDYLKSINPQGMRLRIVARKPHLPYLSRNEWVFFPPVKSIDEFRGWVENNHVDYIAIGKRELKERKELAPLGDPKKAPDWLKPVWVNDDPVFILYKPEAKTE